MEFKLEKAEVKKCLQFAEEAWNRRTQSKRDFGNEKRTREKFIADQAEGKLAEIVLQRFLKTKSIDIDLDFNHYTGERNTDKGDLIISLDNKPIETRIDVKGSFSRAQWLLVEDYKFIDPQTKKHVSKAFIMVRLKLGHLRNEDIRKKPGLLLRGNLIGKVEGWAKAEDFYEDANNQKFWFYWKKKSRPWRENMLPDSTPFNRKALSNHLKQARVRAGERGDLITISRELKANNYGLPIKWLRTDWDEFISLLFNDTLPEFKTDVPIPLDLSVFNYKNDNLSLPSYSFVISVKAEDLTDKQKQCIRQMLYSGIKVFLLTTEDKVLTGPINGTPVLDAEEEKAFVNCHLLSIHVTNCAFTRKNPLIIVDGREKMDLLEKESEAFPSFNFQQYEVEHAPKKDHLAVKAGAGTGKTMVMVQRVICLLQREGVRPSEIALITFTRESSKEMFSRLRKELFTRYKITKQTRYLTYIEELKRMKISTIHSFAKMVLKETGSSLGYGRDMQIRTFVLDRKEIIEKAIEKYLLENNIRTEIEQRISPLKLYELINTINDFWLEMEKKGMTNNDISSLQWGSANPNSQFYNNLFKEIYPKIEKKFQVFKQQQNAVSMNDLTRQVDQSINQESSERNSLTKITLPIKHLFIDEFQDSDDVQIRLIAQIQQALGVTIFAVGDVKQSIYRFRGADHTAFKRLKTELEATGEFISNKKLQTNYRTTKEILGRMHPYFKKWGEEGWLDYKESDQLLGTRKAPMGLPDSPIIFNTIKKEKGDTEIEVIDMIKHAKEQLLLDTESEKGKKKIAALVRTNKEARLLEYWCGKHDIDTYLNIGGTFFNSRAIHDFSILIEALLFPKKAMSIVSLLNTPYSAVGIHWSSIAELNGNQEKIHEYLHEKGLLKDGFDLEKWTGLLRKTPVFSVIRSIIEESRLKERFYILEKQRLQNEEGRSEESANQQATLNAKQYIKNINRLMDLLHEEFDSDFVTLYKVYTWIKRNQAVNRDEDEPLIDNVPDDVVNILTVHRSKGLEFHTVLIPFTDRKFRMSFNEVLFDAHKQVAGWKIKKGQETLKNSYYGTLTDGEEKNALQEETRLLYVAMTRSENQLWILQNLYELYPSRKIDTWAKLLNRRNNE